MPRNTRRDWAAIGRDYAADVLTLAEICARHDISSSALLRWVQATGLPRRMHRRRLARTPAGRRALLIDRLYRVLEQEVLMIEQSLARLAADSRERDDNRGERERQLRTLNSVMRSLDRLIQVEARTRQDAQGEGTKESDNYTEADAERLRRDLARRLQHLRDARRRSG